MALAPGCPQRWRSEHTSPGVFGPARPHVCPCLWSLRLIRDHFSAVMTNVQDLTRLEQLFP